ncbi:hypothetical protein YC2023_039900 [Brassica napus]
MFIMLLIYCCMFLATLVRRTNMYSKRVTTWAQLASSRLLSVIFVIMHGEFVLTQENIEIPRTGKIYSFKEENYRCGTRV